MKTLLARIEKLEGHFGNEDEQIDVICIKKYDASLRNPPQAIPLNYATCNGVTLERLADESEEAFEHRATEHFKEPKRIVLITFDDTN